MTRGLCHKASSTWSPSITGVTQLVTKPVNSDTVTVNTFGLEKKCNL